jgi:hypothetical protein
LLVIENEGVLLPSRAFEGFDSALRELHRSACLSPGPRTLNGPVQRTRPDIICRLVSVRLGGVPRYPKVFVGPGQRVSRCVARYAPMEDEEVLGWLRSQAEGAKKVLSVCTGALLFGGAGLIHGKRATTHWASFHLLPWFGAIPVDDRVVVDGDWIFAAGATSGIDGALRLAAEVRGVPAAQLIQLEIAYAPEPPFHSGTPHTAPPEIAERARRNSAKLIARREATARRAAATLGVPEPHERA